MRCENNFCIYWSDKCCILKEVSLGVQGNCNDCIYVSINEEVLDNERKKLLALCCDDLMGIN